MASITVRNLSEETKARLKAHASRTGRSLEAYVRWVLDQAARSAPKQRDKPFPHDLVALVEPGKAIEPLIETQDQAQPKIEL